MNATAAASSCGRRICSSSACRCTRQAGTQPCGPDVVSYHELEARVQRWAAFLQACGLLRGRRVARMVETGEYLELRLAAAAGWG